MFISFSGELTLLLLFAVKHVSHYADSQNDCNDYYACEWYALAADKRYLRLCWLFFLFRWCWRLRCCFFLSCYGINRQRSAFCLIIIIAAVRACQLGCDAVP